MFALKIVFYILIQISRKIQYLYTNLAFNDSTLFLYSASDLSNGNPENCRICFFTSIA